MNAIVKKRQVDAEVMSVLADGVDCNGPALVIRRQLDRKLYEATNKVLEALGGVWNRKAKAHLFSIDAEDAIEPVLLTGTITLPADYGFFETPPDLVQRVMDKAGIEPGMRVLEPSAGTGNIAAEAARRASWVDCVELQADKAQQLRQRLAKGAPQGMGIVREGDFLSILPTDLSGPYDRVVMNPPFSRQADIKHVWHAFRFLKERGLLVAIMSAGVTFRRDVETLQLRRLIHARGGTIEKLPDGSFKTAGTSVNTVLVTIPFDYPPETDDD